MIFHLPTCTAEFEVRARVLSNILFIETMENRMEIKVRVARSVLTNFSTEGLEKNPKKWKYIFEKVNDDKSDEFVIESEMTQKRFTDTSFYSVS